MGCSLEQGVRSTYRYDVSNIRTRYQFASVLRQRRVGRPRVRRLNLSLSPDELLLLANLYGASKSARPFTTWTRAFLISKAAEASVTVNPPEVRKP